MDTPTIPTPERARLAADRLAAAHPEGRVSLSPALLHVLYDRVAEAGDADPAIPRAVAEGDAVAHALAAGCPPQFHPGVPEEHAAVLSRLRTTLGIDRAQALELAPATPAEVVRLLRAIGCTVVAAAA